MSKSARASSGQLDDSSGFRVIHDQVEQIAAGLKGSSLGAIFALRRDPSGAFTFPFLSPAFEHVTFISVDEIARDAHVLLRFVCDEDQSRVLASLEDSAASLEEWNCEFRIHSPGRGQMWLEGRAVPRRDDDGSVLWYGYFNGVTARKRAELAVQLSESKFQSYVENAPIAIVVVDREGRIEDCNPAGQRMIGIPKSQLQNLTLFDIHHSENHDDLREMLRRLACGETLDKEFHWRLPDGRVLWVQIRAVALDGGRSIGFLQDVTERKRSETELLRERKLLEAFIDHAPVGIAMFNRDMRYVRSSRRWQAMFNATQEQLVGQRHYDDTSVILPHWIEAHQRGLGGETVKGEDEWVRPDSKRAIHRWEVHPWGDSGLDSGGIIIMFEDVTEARTMEDELRHAHKMEALGQLAGGVAHDFNNLLQVIYGYTEIVQEVLASNPDAAAYTGEVLRATRKASSLTRQLLAFSRRQVFAPAVVDVNTVINSTSKMLKRLLGENIDFQIVLDEPLWPVEADADQLSQVLINLCVNARDAMPHGGRLTIRTSNCRVVETGLAGQPHISPGEYVMLTVADNGTGIAPSVMRHIFEPFFTTKDDGKGTGLGLSTVYGIVCQSNGQVWAESIPGNGACIKVCLPRTQKQVQPLRSPGARRLPGGSHTLLIVEDDPDVRCAVAEFLPSLGYKVLTAHPADAFGLAQRHAGALDLLITDVVMPGISGPELARQVSALQPLLPVLYMSGYIDDSVREGVLASQAPFLQKPFTLEELAAAIQRSLVPR